MDTYNLKFKNEPNERGFWNTSIYADSDEEAIEIVERIKGKKSKCILEKIIYKYKTVKKWED